MEGCDTSGGGEDGVEGVGLGMGKGQLKRDMVLGTVGEIPGKVSGVSR